MFSRPATRRGRVSRFKVTDTDPSRADLKSETILWEWPSSGHNGGCLQFGPDGYLYVSTGDSSNPHPADVHNTREDVGDLLASILRIDVDATDPARRVPVMAPAARFVVGACLGARLVPHVPEAALRSAFGGLLLYLGLLFVFDLRPSHPVGLVLAPVTMIIGRVTHRFRRQPAPPTPPAEGHEYYI